MSTFSIIRKPLFNFIILVCLFFTPVYGADELCSSVVIHGDDDLALSETEKRMVCGDPKVPAYKIIPSYEASFFLTSFLQSRGYLGPRFEITNDVLEVFPGKKFYLKKIKVHSELKKERRLIAHELRRLFKGELLTPGLLDAMEGEVQGLLRNLGYPCSEVQVEVDVPRALAVVRLIPRERFKFGSIQKENIKGLHDNALKRFYPFGENDFYSAELLSLTEKRMLRSEVVSGTYFLDNCAESVKDFKLSQYFLVGPPRTIRFGAGASTEVGPMARVRWSNNRYKSMASNLSANLQASLRTQSLTLSADSYFWKNRPRRSLYSQFDISRESQIDFEQFVTKLRPLMKWTRDRGTHHQTYLLGPSFESGTYHSKETSDTKSFSTALIEGSVQLMSHSYEHYDIHPQDGDSLNFNFDFRNPALGFNEQLLKLESSVVKLGRLGDSGRGILVGAARLNIGTTWVGEEVSLKSLPPTVKFFGGGSDDLRGYLLKTLPQNDGLGALTKLGMKLELRRTYLVKESIEGFTFFDLAYFGDRSWQLDSSLFYSPGLGLRWLSPIGLVQGYAARAFRTRPYKDQGHYLFLGIGGTF